MSDSLLAGGNWTISVRHKRDYPLQELNPDPSVRDSFEVLRAKKDWEVVERILYARPKKPRLERIWDKMQEKTLPFVFKIFLLQSIVH